MLNKLFKGFTILLLTLLLILFFLWQRLIIIGVEAGLEGSGYQLDEIRFGELGFSAVHLPWVSVKGEAGAPLATGIFEDVVLEYDLQDLWHGRLSSVEIQRVELAFQADSMVDESPTSATTLLHYLTLTPDKINISQLNWSGISELVDGQVSLQISRSGLKLTGQIIDLNDRDTQLRFNVVSGPVAALDVVLNHHNEPGLKIDSQISFDDKQRLDVNGELSLQNSAIEIFAARYMKRPYHGGKDLSGEFVIRWSGSISDDLGALLQSAQLDWNAKINASGLLVAKHPLKFQTKIDLLGQLEQGRVALVLKPGSELTVDAPFENELMANANAQVRLNNPLQMKIGPLGGGVRVGAEVMGELTISLLGNEQQIELELGLEHFSCKQVNNMSCQIAAALVVDAEQLQVSQYRLSGLKMMLESALDVNQQGVDVSINPGAQASLKSLTLPEVALQDLQLRGGRAGLRLDFERNKLEVSLSSLNLSAASARYQEYQLAPAATLTDFRASLDNTLAIKTGFAAGPWEIKHPENWLPPLPKMSGQLLLADTHLEIKTQLFGNLPQVSAQVNLQHRIESNQSHLKFKLHPVDWQGKNNKLATLFPGWPYPVGVVSGQMHAAGDLTVKWPPQGAPQVAGQLNTSLNNLTGFAEDTYFSGLSTEMVSQLQPGDDSLVEFSGKLRLDAIDVGLAVTDLVLDYNAAVDTTLQRGKLKVEGLGAHLLGGILKMPAVEFDLAGPAHQLVLELNNLSLKQLVELGDYPEFEISGAVHGQLPVSISDQGVRIDQGWFEAKPPGGVIRYQQDLQLSLEATNPQLQLVRDVLRNFEYDSLKAQVNYSEQEELLLTVQILGANPEVADGRKIHLNLNLEESIADLLRSLKMSREFLDFIQDKFSQEGLP